MYSDLYAQEAKPDEPDDGLYCAVCRASCYVLPSGKHACTNKHQSPELVDAEGNPVDLELLGLSSAQEDEVVPRPLDPQRERKLEATVASLSSRLARTQHALRKVVQLPGVKKLSDRGTAPWYQEALRALKQEDPKTDQ